MSDILKDIQSQIGKALEIKDKIWSELSKEWQIDKEVSFNELNLKEKLEKKGFLHIKYHDQLINEKTKLDILEERLEEELGKQYDFYKFESNKMLLKSEIERYYLPKDKHILKVKKLILYQSFRYEYFKMCVDVINQWGWDIKHFLENGRQGY